MRYSCRDIDKIIERDFRDDFDQESLIGHIESCPQCGARFQLDSQLEDILSLKMRETALISFSEQVMAKTALIESEKKYLAKGIMISWASAAICIFILVGAILSNSKSLFSTLNTLISKNEYSHLSNISNSFLSLIPGLKSLFTLLISSPLFLLILAGIAISLWTFSITGIKEQTE